MNLLRLSYTVRPCSTARMMVAKLSSERIMRPAFLATCGAGAHGDADVGRLDRRSVVHAVAGHGDDVALLPERLDEQHLVLGRDAPDHADVVDARQPLLFAQRGELRPEHRGTGDAELLGDGRPGGHVVAGDHAHPDVGALGIPDGRLGLVAGRVDHGDEGRHLEIGDVAQQVAFGIEGGGVEIAEGRRHHAMSFALHAGDGVLRPLLQRVVPRHAGAGGEGARRAAHHGGRRPLHEAAHHASCRTRRWRS